MEIYYAIMNILDYMALKEFKAFNDGLSPKDCFEYGERSNYEVFIDELAINKINYDEVVAI